MTAEALLSRLDKVRRRGADQWSARCPAHDDKGPSLSVKELPDGRLLLRCFAGCTVDEVACAVGLDLSDLFPLRPNGHGVPAPRRRGLLTAGQALEVIQFECLLTWTAAFNLANGHTLTADDLERLSIAAQRIQSLATEVRA